MNVKKVFIAIALVVIIGSFLWVFCTRNKCLAADCIQQQEVERHTFFIQGVADSAVLAVIKKELEPIVNNIVKEELGLTSDDINFFLPKDGQRLTLYSTNNIIYDAGKSLVFKAVDEVLQEHPQKFTVKNVQLMPHVNLFGANKDELVIMVDDAQGELLFLHQQMKAAMHQAYEAYKTGHGIDLYDVAKSEQFSYVPHIGLGRIRSTSIKERIQDKVHIDTLYGRIMQRIADESLAVVQKLLHGHDTTIAFKGLCIFDLPSRACIKEWELK